MAPQLIDFDAARAERADEPLLNVKAGGQTIALFRPSAEVVLDWFRAMRDPKSVDPDGVLKLYEGLFGDKLNVLQAALSPAELNELAGRYCGEAMQESQPPNRKARRARKTSSRSTSSRGGRCSRRTSSASTGSTSASI